MEYGEKYDKLFHFKDKFVDGGVKTFIHILNGEPSKSVPKTSYELWIGREPLLNCLRLWDC